VRALLWLLRIAGLLPAVVYGLEWLGVPVPYVRLSRPLLAIPLAVLLVWLTTRLARFSARRPRARAQGMALLTGVAATASAFAVVGVELGRKLDRLTVILAVDRSRSIDLVPAAASRIEQELQLAELGMREGDRIGTLAFAAEAVMESPLRERRQPPAPQRAELGRDGTDLGAAIRRGLSEVPPDSAARIVLMSDGVSTRGDALAEAALAGGRPVEAYAYARTGYHRGLDAMRANGWRNSGYVRWHHRTNRAFLCALDGLRRMASEIGEADEAERCETFLDDSDPAARWAL